jgi:hypothetical protein
MRQSWLEEQLQPDRTTLPSIDMLAGDFNCSPEPFSHSPAPVQLQAFIDTYGLADTPPTNTNYTF